jgi:hypothetical protein
VGGEDQMLDAQNESVASSRSYGVVVGKMLPTQEMSRSPKDHHS